MAISVDMVKDFANSPAVTCCRFEAGEIISPAHLEDPALFADLEDSGLLSMPDNFYTINQVIGATLQKTISALTPITAEYVKIAAEPAPAPAPPPTPAAVCENNIRIFIGEGKNIELFIPANIQPSISTAAPAPIAPQNAAPKTLRSLTRKYFTIKNIEFGDKTKISGQTLILRHPDQLCKEAVAAQKLVVDMRLDIITPDRYCEYSDTIMDVLPIACKEQGELGAGITRVLDGVVFIISGIDANGVQIGEFGSSEGHMDKKIMWGRPGAPDYGEIFIKAHVTIQPGANMERPGPLAAHLAADHIMSEIREALKNAENTPAHQEDFIQTRRPGKPKILIIKEIMGQGAMHDNLILPNEPVGTMGGVPNVDLGNLPVVLSPLEVLDGGIHALTCIGPASKETSRHYFREPLVAHAMSDPDIDLAGIIFIGSPQANADKFYVSRRLGMMIEAMDADGAIVGTEGFGNNHIDFASHIEQIGSRGIAVVGMSYSARQGALVVGNKHMRHMIDLNKSAEGIENEILCVNTLTHEDAIRALAMLKAALSGEPIAPAPAKWSPDTKAKNITAIESATGKKIPLTNNETAL